MHKSGNESIISVRDALQRSILERARPEMRVVSHDPAQQTEALFRDVTRGEGEVAEGHLGGVREDAGDAGREAVCHPEAAPEEQVGQRGPCCQA